MHVCQESKLTSAVCCPVCGQSFLIYSDQGLHVGQDACRRIIRHALRNPSPATAQAIHLNIPSAHPTAPLHYRIPKLDLEHALGPFS